MMDDPLLLLMTVLAATIIASACIVFFAAVLHWGRDRDSGLLPYIFYPAVGISVLGVILSGQHLDYTEITPLISIAKSPLLQTITKLGSLFLLFASGERLMNALVRLRPVHHVSPMLTVALAIFFSTNIVCSALLATHPSYSNEYLYNAVAAAAALLATPADKDKAVIAIRNVAVAFLILSAAYLLWDPYLVLGKNYHGWIPFVTVRYAGLMSGPNVLGEFVVLFMLCLWAAPFQRRVWNIVGWTLAGLSLLFSQSKTNVIAILVCAAIMVYFQAERTPGKKQRSLALQISMLSLFSGVLVAAGALVLFNDTFIDLEALYSARGVDDLMTLVGRTVIWDVAIEAWKNNPLFGYGLTIWDSDFRARVGLPDALHAHNQFFHSLSSSGTVGVIGLIAYSCVLLWLSVKTARASRGLSISLFVFMFIRSLSEVPLIMMGYGMEQLPHLLLLIVIAAHLSGERAQANVPLFARTPILHLN